MVGTDGKRMIVSVAGKDADQVLVSEHIQRLSDLSVARLDIQITTPVADPDAVIIHMRPPKLYKSVLYYSVYEEGATMYVGAPTSRARLRIYNKSAQSGERSTNGMRLLRVELQLRNEYADRVLRHLRSNSVDQYYMFHCKKMCDAYVYSIVERAIGEGVTISVTDEADDDDQSARRKRWLEDTVATSIRKFALIDHEYIRTYLQTLLDAIGSERYAGDE